MKNRMWAWLAQTALGGAAIASLVGVTQAQVGAPKGPSLPVIPAVVQSAPQIAPILPVSGQEPRLETPALPGAPRSPIVPTSADTSANEDLKSRIDRLEKQNQELMKLLSGMRSQPTPQTAPTSTESVGGGSLNKDDVQKIVGDYLNQRDAANKAVEAAKKSDAEAKGYTVGSNLGLTAKWNNGLWFESVDKAFKFHIGGRTQFDMVFTSAGNDVQFAKGGMGAYDDGVNFRRGRFAMEGSAWEVLSFNMEWDFINTTQAAGTAAGSTATFNTPVPTDLWVQFSQIPWIGNIRIGNHKPWIGFEHLTSSRFLNFLERSPGFDSFIEDGNNGFSPGISTFDTWGPNENGMWAVGLFKTTRAIFGWNTGDGEWSGVARATWLPIYCENGRQLLHFGMGAQFRDLDNSQIRFRTRTEERNAPAALHNIVAIAQTSGNSQLMLNPELVANYGPWTFQAEYTYSQVYGVDRIITTPSQSGVNIPKQTFVTQGAYAEVLYFLTGEHRLYNKKNGAFDRVIPNRNYYLVHGEDGGRLFQSGAWQVGARYSYLDLNDGPIRGGQLNDATLGLNWFLNPNFKIQWNYSYGYRSVSAAADGAYHGFGMRFALDW